MCGGLATHQIIQKFHGVELIKYAWTYTFPKGKNSVKGFVVRFVVSRRAGDLVHKVTESNLKL